MHSYDEPIEVRTGMVPGWSGAVGPATTMEGPATVVWRERVWLVREIQACWTQTAPWWEGAAARAVRGETVPDDADADLLGETEVWRVLADDARYHRSAVLELSHGCGTGTWRLQAVRD